MPTGGNTATLGDSLLPPEVIATGVARPWRPFGGSSNSGSAGNSGEAAADGARDYQEYWDESNILDDWAKHIDTYGHNEALAAYEREKEASAEAWAREADYNAKEAEKQRMYEEYMSNTSFQRKVADYVKAGFSPLAALEGSVGASTPSAAAASANYNAAKAPAATRGANNFGSLLGAIIGAVAMIATKGISAVAKGASSSAKAVAKAATVKEVAKEAAKESVKKASGPVVKEALERSAKKGGMMLGGKWFSDEELYKIARTRWVK